MRIASKIALVAALTFGVFSTAAFADGPPVWVLVATVGGNNPGTPGNNNCTALCSPPATTASEVNYHACGDKLGQLRRITSRQVGRIDETDVVHLVPLCDSVGHTLTETETQYLARGNVGGLLTTIDRNPVLMAELTDGGYKANDVLGIALGPNAAVLYVHKQ